MKVAIRLSALAILLTAGCFLALSKSDDAIRARVVKLSSARNMCTGEQVRAPSGVDYILTAGHCRLIADANGYMTVTTEDGKILKRKIIAEDEKSDLLLLEGLPGVQGLDIAQYVYEHQAIRTFTHGSNMVTHKTEGELIETHNVAVPMDLVEDDASAAKCTSQPKFKVLDLPSIFGSIRYCVLSVDEVATTAKITPGSSGGPVVDSSGDLVGVASATDENWGYLVTLKDIKAFIRNY